MNTSPNPDQPRMSPRDIISLFFNELPINPKRAYRYFSRSYRTRLGDYQGFKHKYDHDRFWEIMNSYPSWDVITINLVDDTKTQAIYKLRYLGKDKMLKTMFVQFSLSQQYNYAKNKPLYDRWTKNYLYGYWRIDDIQRLTKQKKEHFTDSRDHQTNLFGKPLHTCSTDPLTGWSRSGKCEYHPNDGGVHTVCARMTQDFLDYTKRRGNDLSTPRGSFPGLKPNDKWCLCEQRWKQAKQAKKHPPVIKRATHRHARHLFD